MGQTDPPETQRAVGREITVQLAASGFANAQEVGSGGLGIVYRCTQTALDRIVAVKVLTAHLEEENQKRFVREQRAMDRLTGHQNIVGVLQAGITASGLPYWVMPYYPLGSLDARVVRHGPLSVEETSRVGVQIAGALETAHRLGILHRDIKPGNILIGDYGESALTDFGIARIAGGFRTTAGTVTGSPAFTAPEVLAGDEPTAAADVYSLGATCFAALTGHAAFERRSGEQVVAQFRRIIGQPTPILREYGIDEDISTAIECAMARDLEQRPSAAALGERLQQLQAGRGWPVEGMAVRAAPGAESQESTPGPSIALDIGRSRVSPASSGSLVDANVSRPLELTSFVGRRAELIDAKSLLTSSRLVTLTGIGGVGKTRLALRVMADAQRNAPHAVSLVQLAELQDDVLMPGVIAAAVGLRPQAQPVLDALIRYLAPKHLLLVLDNCEHIVDAAATIAETLLMACPQLRILATSREPLNIGGEAVLRVQPLTVPAPDRELSLRGVDRYDADAVTLFVERAAAVVPGFALTEDNVATVTEICRQLDGLPLAIELAAARLRTLSPQQILQRLTDRYAFLTRGARSSPGRQQTLRWCIDWSYSLCTPAEQMLWARMSVFAGSFELDAVEYVCRDDLGAVNIVDVLTTLVDKSILIREELGSLVRFRLLETVLEYGREKLAEARRYTESRHRHLDWYRQLAERAEADWISPRQLDWISRLDCEQPNLREALDFCLTGTEAESDAALSLSAALQLFWFSRGQLAEARHWLDRALAGGPTTATALRAKALWRATIVTISQNDLAAAAALVVQARALAERTGHPIVHAFTDLAKGLHAVRSGDDPSRARAPLETALASFTAQGDVYGQIWALLGLGWVHEFREDSAAALSYHEQTLAITEFHGDAVYRSYALCDTAVAVWRQGDRDRALRLLRAGLRLIGQLKDPFMAAIALETLAWVVGAQGSARRAAVLLGAARGLSRTVGGSAVLYPDFLIQHEACKQAARHTLGQPSFDTAYRTGAALDLDAAIDYALEGQSKAAAAGRSNLTSREREVADLVADGLTNRAIAARLSISPRTAGGHVEHILTKLGFTSRAQIAGWVAQQNQPAHS
ncbi:protein kinase domain-containing protein [Nocardia sp. CA-151230]|uniref:protein kinase domain-containing protein n=1 Tax=Nocardia sp. CA-151230 TaxID=3239982 RepID=UPI003D8F30B7